MADDNTIVAKTRVDTSGLKAGMDQSQTIVASGLADIKAQYAAAAASVKTATQNLAEAQQQFGQFAAAGNREAQAALAEYEAELATATVAQAELSSALESGVSATTAAASATYELAAAHGAAVTEIQATSAALRVLEGTGGIRAAERLLTIIPGIGEALQVAFPVVGAAALAEVLYRVVERVDPLVEAEKNLEKITRDTDREFERLEKTFEHLQIEQATAQLGKLSGMKVAAFYSDTSAAEDTANIKHLQELIEQTKQKISEEGDLASFFSNPLKALNPFLIGQKIGELGVPGLYGGQQKADLKNLQAYEEEIEGLEEKGKVAAEQAKTDQIRAHEDAVRAQEAAVRKSIELDRQQFEATQALNRAEIDQAKERTREISLAMEEGLKQWEAAVEEETRLGVEELRTQDEEAKGAKEWAKTIEEAQKQAAAALKKAADERRAIDTSGSDTAIGGLQGQKDDLAVQQAAIFNASIQEQTAYLEKVREIDQQIETLKFQHQVRMLQLDSVNGETKQAEQDMQKLVQIEQQGHQQIEKDNLKILQKEQQDYQNFFNQINSEATHAFNDLLTHPKKFASDLEQLWTKMVTDFADKLLMMVVQEKEADLIKTLSHAQAVAANAAADAAGAAKHEALTIAQTLKDIQADAAGAAAKAYNWAAAWGGPIAGVAAGGAAYAGVIAFEGLAQLETGTNYVPRTGPYQLHEGEAVVPKQYNPGAGGAGGGHTFNINVHPAAGAGGRQIGKDIATSLREFARRGNLLPAGVKI